MKKLVFALLAVAYPSLAAAQIVGQATGVPRKDLSKAVANRAWEERAQNVTITRDDWGIAHVHGKTDADAVFGMIYAQAEDDFPRIENNYLSALGRMAQAEGEK